MWSGGKDSYLALNRVRRQGPRVATLVNIYDQASGLVRFHATRPELIAAQAFALGLRLHQHAAPPGGYEDTFRRALAQLAASGHRGVVFGNIHLADVRAWFEDRVRGAGLEHLEPLWLESPAALLAEFVDSGARALVTCIELVKLPGAWLGRTVDEGFLTDIARVPGVDPCGERGEYHTFVHSSPLFDHPIAWRPGPIHEAGGFAELELLAR